MEFDNNNNNKLDDRNSRMQKMREAFGQWDSPGWANADDAYIYGHEISRRYSKLNKDKTKWNQMSFWEKLKPSSWWHAGDEYTGFDSVDLENASTLFEERLAATNLTEAQKNEYRRAFKKGFAFSDQEATQYNASERDATEYLMQQASEGGTSLINPVVRTLTGGKANTWAEFVSADGLDADTITTSGDLLKRYADVRGTREATKLGLKGMAVHGAGHVLANAWTYPTGYGWIAGGDAVNHFGRTAVNMNNIQKNPNKWVGNIGQGMEIAGDLMAYKGAVGLGVKGLPPALQAPISNVMYTAPAVYYTLKNLWGAGQLAVVNNVDVLSGPANAGDRDAEFNKYVTENMKNKNLDDPNTRTRVAAAFRVSPDTDQATLKGLLQQDMERTFGLTRADDVLANTVVQFSATSGKNEEGKDGEIRADKNAVLDTMTKLRSSGMSRDAMVDNMLGQLDAWHRQHNQNITNEALSEIKAEFLEEYYEATRREVSRGNYVDPNIFLSKHFTDAQAKTLIKTHIQAEDARLSSSNGFVDLVRQGMSYMGGEKTTTLMVVNTMGRSAALQDSMAAYFERAMCTSMGLRESTDKDDDSLSDDLGVDANSIWRALGTKRQEQISDRVVGRATPADIVKLSMNKDLSPGSSDVSSIVSSVSKATARRCNVDGQFAGQLVMEFMPKLREMSGGQSGEQMATFLSTLDPEAIANNMKLEEMKALVPIIAQLASDNTGNVEMSEDLIKLKTSLTDALMARCKKELRENTLEAAPIVSALYLASKGHPRLAEFFSDPFTFYGTALLVLIGGSWLLSGLFGGDDDEDAARGGLDDKQAEMLKALFEQRRLQAGDNGANYELNI